MSRSASGRRRKDWITSLAVDAASICICDSGKVKHRAGLELGFVHRKKGDAS